MKSTSALRQMLPAFSAAPLLAACGDRPETPLVQSERGRPIQVEVYDGIGDCAAAGRLDEARCRRGLREAMARHPLFAPKWASHELCEAEHGKGACARIGDGGAAYSSPRPVAFLAYHAGPGGCRFLYFAPVYRSVSFDRFTGQGGGYIGRAPGLGPPAGRARFQVGRTARHPPIV